MVGHALPEQFTLIGGSSLQPVELQMETLGSMISLRARGLADHNAPPISVTVRGEALRPPSPVHLRAVRTSSGEVHATWIRRSRVGWSWLDGTDVALGESTERFRIRIESANGSVVVETVVPEALIASGQLAPLGAGPLTVSVVQVGDYAESRPTSTIIS